MDDTAPHKPDPWIGRTIAGQFHIIDRLGEGGMGSVYLADQIGMDRRVVVKVVLGGLVADESMATRFSLEARTLARLRHPNIVQVLTSGETDNGALYLVMELVEGQTLGDEMSSAGPIPEARVVHIARQITAALAAAHEAGVIHRDLKPSNVMLTEHPGNPDHVVVLDFGIAKVVEQKPGSPQLTGTGMLMGTPAYMSPEQIELRPLDGRSDLYSLGVILYEMATGANPFSAPTPIESLIRHLQEPVPSARQGHPSVHVSAWLEAIIASCLAKHPDQRPASARALLHELNSPPPPGSAYGIPARYPQSNGRSSVRGGLVLAAALAVVVAGLAVVWMLWARTPERARSESIAAVADERGADAAEAPGGDDELGRGIGSAGPSPTVRAHSDTPVVHPEPAGQLAADLEPPPPNAPIAGEPTGPPKEGPTSPVDGAEQTTPIRAPPTQPTHYLPLRPQWPTTPSAPIVQPVLPAPQPPEPIPLPDDVDACLVAVEHHVVCDRDWDDFVPPECDVADGPELHILAAYRPASPDGVVGVEINRTAAPIILVLSAYGETTWALELAEGVTIERVITTGYERSEVTGLPSNVRVEWRSGRRSSWPIMGWAWQEGGTSTGRELTAVAEEDTELRLRAYAGCYNPTSFTIGQRWP